MAGKTLSEAGRQDLAMALLLLKDFKSGGQFDMEVSKMVFDLADYLGVREEVIALLSKVPVMRIEPR